MPTENFGTKNGTNTLDRERISIENNVLAKVEKLNRILKMNDYRTPVNMKSTPTTPLSSQDIFMQPLYEQLMNYEPFGEPPKPNKHYANESAAARGRRMARNAERMRERRANESDEDYRRRLDRTAAYNKNKRDTESEEQREMRRLKDAARQRLRRAMETDEERQKRLQKLAERMRLVRAAETDEQRAIRLADLAARARMRISKETAEQRVERLQKQLEYAKRQRQSNYESSLLSQPKCEQTTKQMFTNQSNVVTYQNVDILDSKKNGVQILSIPTYMSGPGIHKIESMGIIYPALSSLPQAQPSLQSRYLPQTQPPPQTQSQSQTQPMQPPPQTQPLSQPVMVKTQPMDTPKRHANFYRNNSDTITNRTFDIQNSLIYGPKYHEIMMRQQQNPAPSSQPTLTPTVSMQHQSRGRPRKIVHHATQIPYLSTEMKLEYEKQLTMSELLGMEINKMMHTPRNARGRPSNGYETPEQRSERLRKMAEKRREQRMNETPEERRIRLADLVERARIRRAQIKANETECEKQERLNRQAEYARNRRDNRLGTDHEEECSLPSSCSS